MEDYPEALAPLAELYFALRDLFDAWRSLPAFATPDLDELQRASALRGVVASDARYAGEPWFADPSLNTRLFALGFLACAGAGAFSLDASTIEAVSRWIVEHCGFAWAMFLPTFAIASAWGALRQVLNALMANAVAIPTRMASGGTCLVYLGDVPSFAWTYSARPRIISFAAVACLTLIAAALGAALLGDAFGVSMTAAFWSIAALRVALSAAPAVLLAASIRASYRNEQEG